MKIYLKTFPVLMKKIEKNDEKMKLKRKIVFVENF